MKAQAVGTNISRLLKRVCEKQGFSQVDILTRWPDIVGAELAQNTQPLRLKYVHDRRWPGGEPWDRGERSQHGVLTVRVDGPVALELQYLAPQLLERINTFYGHRAVGRLQLVQGPVTRRPAIQRRSSPKLTPMQAANLHAAVASVKDPKLSRAIERLGAWVKDKNSREGHRR